MPIKRLLILLSMAALFACVFAVLNATLSTAAVCACGTVDGTVIAQLNKVDAIILQYRINHDGLSPTYSELQELVSSDSWHSPMLTPDVDFTSQVFTFHITDADADKLGYAVSSDRRDYILLGIGLQTRELSLFGWGPIPVGYEIPIWRPGDIAPDNKGVIR